MAISMLKIRRPLGRLIFNMGIAIPGKTVYWDGPQDRKANVVLETNISHLYVNNDCRNISNNGWFDLSWIWSSSSATRQIIIFCIAKEFRNLSEQDLIHKRNYHRGCPYFYEHIITLIRVMNDE